MKRIQNTTTGKPIWRGEEYLVDGQPGTVDPPLYLLTEVRVDPPAYDAATEVLESISPAADLTAMEWRNGWNVRAKTQPELDADAAAAAQATEEDQARQVYNALKNGTGTQLERLVRVERVCAAMIRRLFGAWAL